MDENAIQQLIERAFPLKGRDEWMRTATAEINDNEPLKKLSWRDADGLTFLPYYDKRDVADLTNAGAFDLAPSYDVNFQPRHWLNVPPVAVSDAASANKRALDHLMGGADGIHFVIPRNFSDADALLKDILPQHCLLSFGGDLTNEFALRASSILGSHPLAAQLVWSTIPDNFSAVLLTAAPQFRTLALHVSASTPVGEIAEALHRGAMLFRKFEGHDISRLITRVAFSLPATPQLFHTVSKLKALRALWYQVARAFGIKDYKPSDLHIQVRTGEYVNDKFEPHGNMLENTVCALGAVLGGCNSLTLYAGADQNPVTTRITRNVSTILMEESHVGKVADAVSGAYAIECMSYALAEEAWSAFQKKMNS